MVVTYDRYYTEKQEYLSYCVEEGLVRESNAEAIRKLCDAFDDNKPTTKRPRWPDAPDHLTNPREDSTLGNWMYYLTEYAKHVDLLDTTHDELNAVAERWLNGDAKYKDGSLARGTIRVYQCCARMFYRYHDVDGVEHEQIVTFEQANTSIDPRDMLDVETGEIEAVRQSPDHPRDRAIVYMLLYTGLRNGGLRTLRVRDVDTDENIYYFNDSDGGLKNIYKPSAPRPLLGATAAANEWLKYHPHGDDPDAYFIVQKPNYNVVQPHNPVSNRCIERVMENVKDDTGIQKPLHPHMMRHNAVSIWKRDYDMDNDTIKFLIGHRPDSNVMETTYSHLSAQDHARKAEVAAGLREESDESPYTPDYCDVCNEPMAPDDKACSRCGTVYTPDAKTTEEAIEDAMFENKGLASTDNENDAVDKLRTFLKENPEVKAILLGDPPDDT